MTYKLCSDCATIVPWPLACWLTSDKLSPPVHQTPENTSESSTKPRHKGTANRRHDIYLLWSSNFPTGHIYGQSQGLYISACTWIVFAAAKAMPPAIGAGAAQQLAETLSIARHLRKPTPTSAASTVSLLGASQRSARRLAQARP